MKNLFILSLIVLLSGCEADYETKTDSYKLPPELADCSVYQLSDKVGSAMKVVRCPNATTSSTYRSGKATKSSVVIDGVEYTKK
jgi:hypothetical protein